MRNTGPTLGKVFTGLTQVFSFVSFLGQEGVLRAKMDNEDGTLFIWGKLIYRASLLVCSENHLCKSNTESDGVLCVVGDVLVGQWRREGKGILSSFSLVAAPCNLWDLSFLTKD